MNLVLRTNRLLMRPLEAGDLNELMDLYADADVMRFIGEGRSRNEQESRESLERALNHWSAHGFGMFAIIRQADGQFLGRGGVGYLHAKEGAELAFAFKRSCWGKGFAFEAAAEIVRFAFEELRLPLLVGVARHANPASLRVLDKLGFMFDRVDHFDGDDAVVMHLRNSRTENLDHQGGVDE